MVEIHEIYDETLEDLMMQDDYAGTKNLVTAHLFSRYPERRDIALRFLRRIWQNDLLVATEENTLETFAYIKFHGQEKYFLVSIYKKSEEFPEGEPSAQERRLWSISSKR